MNSIYNYFETNFQSFKLKIGRLSKSNKENCFVLFLLLRGDDNGIELAYQTQRRFLGVNFVKKNSRFLTQCCQRGTCLEFGRMFLVLFEINSIMQNKFARYGISSVMFSEI